MPLDIIPDYIVHAANREREEESWQMWSKLYPWMMAGFIPPQAYKDFKKDLDKPKRVVSVKSSKEIREEMLAVVAAYEGQVMANGNL